MIRRLLFVLICLGCTGGVRAQGFEFSVQPALALMSTLQAPSGQPTGFSLEQQKPGALEMLFGMLPAGYAGQAVGLRLMTWSLPWIGAGVIGLWASSNDAQKGFWGMNAAWALINTGIAYAGFLGAEPDPSSLRTILLVNAGLDVLYIAGGVYLLSRPEEVWRGGGVAVIIQGAFLLVFDLLHAFLIPGL